MWQGEEGFKEVVRKGWEQDVGNGNNMERVKSKLKEVKKELKSWSTEVVNGDNRKKKTHFK